MRTPNFGKNLRPQCSFLLLWLFLSEILSRRCRLLDSREPQAILLKKVGKIRPKLRFFCSLGEKNGTILSRRSRLSRTSRALSARLIVLIRPRLIDCDGGPKQTMKIFPGFGQSFFPTSSKMFFQKVRHLVTIYTPKEAHSRTS